MNLREAISIARNRWTTSNQALTEENDALRAENASLKARYNDLLGNASIDHVALRFAVNKVTKLEVVVETLLVCIDHDRFPGAALIAKAALNPQETD